MKASSRGGEQAKDMNRQFIEMQIYMECMNFWTVSHASK